VLVRKGDCGDHMLLAVRRAALSFYSIPCSQFFPPLHLLHLKCKSFLQTNRHSLQESPRNKPDTKHTYHQLSSSTRTATSLKLLLSTLLPSNDHEKRQIGLCIRRSLNRIHTGCGTGDKAWLCKSYPSTTAYAREYGPVLNACRSIMPLLQR